MGVLTALGIDLGTTESVAVVYVDEVDGVPAHSVKVKLSPTKDSLPSVVCKTKEKTWLVGEPAIVYHKMNPDTILLSRTKRLLGLTYAQAKKEGILKDLKYDVIEGSGNNAEKPVVIVDGEEIIPEKVAALILGAIIEKAAPVIQSKGGEVGRALVTVPAYFSNIQLNAMKAALGMVSTTGLATYREGFAREPSAAAFDFMHEVHDPNELKYLLMFDFGGGTLDVSVIFQETPEKLEVKGQAGDLFLGGEDLDDKMVELVRKGFNREVPKDAEKPSRAKQERLKDACKVAKEQLQQGMTTYTVQVEDYCKTKQGENLNLCVEVTGKEFDKAISTTLDKCLDVVQAAISAAAKTSGIAFTGADLQKVIMVGGSSQLILMQKKLEDIFPGKVHRVNNPDVAVAMGAARLAWLYEQTTRGGTADGARALTISDSVPIGLGISALNDLNQRHMEIIFPEGTPFATERVKTFYTAEDNQKEILVRVLQGNRDDPLGLHKNTELTRQTVRVPKKPRGKVAIDVRMHVDIDGCLTVTVVDDATRNTTKFTVEKRDMWRGPDQYRQLIEQARADNAQQEELKALNAKLTDLFAIFKSFKEDVEYLKGTPEVDDDERAVWSDLEEEVEALRASTPADIDLDTAGALLERLEAEDKAVSERAEQLRANDKKRKRYERDELEEDGELEEDEDYNKDEGEG